MECGIDIVDCKRIEKAMQNQLFISKYFSKEEVLYINSKNNMVQTVAGLFACKEAVLKALGIGIGAGLALKEISIIHNQNGQPKVQVTAKIDYFLQGKNCSQISVSISHDGQFAVAMCVIA